MKDWIGERGWKWQLFFLGGLILSFIIGLLLMFIGFINIIPYQFISVYLILPPALWVYLCIYLRGKQALEGEKQILKVPMIWSALAYFIPYAVYPVVLILTLYPSRLSFLKVPLFILTFFLYYWTAFETWSRLKKVVRIQKIKLPSSKLIFLFFGLLLGAILFLLVKTVGVVIFILLWGAFSYFFIKNLNREIKFRYWSTVGFLIVSFFFWTLIFLASIIVYVVGIIKALL